MDVYSAARAAGIQFVRKAQPKDVFLNTKELTLHYLDWGTEGRQPVLFLHGFAQTCHSWDFTALALCEDYHVVALDQRGHGDSSWASDSDYSPDAFQRDLDELLRHVFVRPPILVGLSMGGRNAYLLASRMPEAIKALVIVDHGPTLGSPGGRRIRSFVSLPDELDTFDEFVQRVHQYNPRRPIEQVRGSLLHNLKQNASGKWTWKYDRVLREPGYSRPNLPVEEAWRRLRDIQCPTLLVRGAESDVLPVEVAEKMSREMHNCTYVEVERAGHLVPGDNPAGFINALKPWLNGLS